MKSRPVLLLALACFLLLPSPTSAMLHPVQNRFLQRDPAKYEAGMGLYEAVASHPTEVRDPTGKLPRSASSTRPTVQMTSGSTTVNLSRDLSRTVPPCPCIENPSDCYWFVLFLGGNDQVIVHGTVQGSDGNRHVVRPGHPLILPGESLSSTYDDGAFRQFSEGVFAVVGVQSRSGRDVSCCHIHQDVVDHWSQDVGGTVADDPAPDDFGLVMDGPQGVDKAIYGGWWLIDLPVFHRFRRHADGDAAQAYARVFFQAKVYVEENPKVQSFWGFWARADYSATGAGQNALVEKVRFGPSRARMPNPYVRRAR